MKKHIFIFVGGPRTGKSKLANFIDPCRDIKVHDVSVVDFRMEQGYGGTKI